MTAADKHFLGSGVLCWKSPFLFFLGLTVLSPPAGARGDLARFRNSNRILLIFAPGVSGQNWRLQNKLLAGSTAQFRERELLRFDIFEHGASRGPEGRLDSRAALRVRARYGVKPYHFRVLLIGKDGHVAFDEPMPVTLNNLMGRIDRMPMRRAEMRRRHESRPTP